MEAVESLYADELRPFGRLLRKRLLELQPGLASLNLQQLRGLCQEASLEITEEAGGEWSALIRGRVGSFVDVYSPQDMYAGELWQAVAAYFASMPPDAPVLSGGRYACGAELRRRQLPFLHSASLGRICHVVQLAISQKKILGYQGSDVVPYARSQSFRKDLSAQGHAASQPGSIASWDLVRACLRELLAAEGGMPLSNLKRLFRARFQLELSETALGCAKLSELLRDGRLDGVCHLRLENGGYMVRPGAEEAQDEPEDVDYEGALAAFHGGHFQDSVRSLDCPWGPTPEGSFILPGPLTTSPPEVSAALEQQRELAEDDEDEEDYDAAVDRFYGGGEHDSIRTMDCFWGPTPEPSFNECDPQTQASVLDALTTARLAPLAEFAAKTDGASSTEEGDSADEV